MHPFFGLTDEYQVYLHETIFDLCHYGKLQYDAVYSMPVQFRNFYLKKLSNIKEKERGELDKAAGLNQASPTSKVVKGPQLNRG